LVRNEPGDSQDKVVYMALRAHFSDRFSQLRKAKTIRARIQNCRDCMWVRLLLQKYDINTVCRIAARLLAQNVFDSKTKADAYFVARGKNIFLEGPEIPTRAQVEFHTDDTVNLEAKIAQENIEIKSQPVMLSSFSRVSERTTETLQATEERWSKPHIKYISQAEQHKTLRETQDIVEATFFKYASKYMREILSQKQWFCEEAVELHEWTRVLRERQDRFDPGILETLPRGFDEILDSLTQLRHAAVHRLHVPLVRVLGFIMDAESISKLCEDDASSGKLNLLRRKLETSRM
jgi:hypothetical protein